MFVRRSKNKDLLTSFLLIWYIILRYYITINFNIVNIETFCAIFQKSGHFCPTPTIQATYYVAPDGDNNNPGTLAEPFATITKARDGAIASQTIIAPKVKRIFSVKGANETTRAHHIKFEGLRFEA